LTQPGFSSRERRLLILAPPAVFLLFVALLFASNQERRERASRVHQTYGVIGMLEQLHGRLVDAETRQRGFLITGDTAYLEPYRVASNDTRTLLDSLGLALTGSPDTAARLEALRQIVTRRLTALQHTLERRAESFDLARDWVIAGHGLAVMDTVRSELAGLDSWERQYLQTELAAEGRANLLMLAVLFAGAMVILVVAGFTRRRFSRYEQELHGQNAALGQLNESLQQQAVKLERQAGELQRRTTRLEVTTTELRASNEALELQRARLEVMAAELENANEELRTASELAEQRTAEAEAANRVKTQFLTSMSHELRTPLNAIGGYADLLDLDIYGHLTEGQRNSVERIKLNARHLLVLINDILDYAKIQAGKLELHPRDVRVGELIAETAELVQPLLQAKNISFNTHIDGAEVDATGDPDRIRQILLNLFTNAVKYSDADTEVTVTARADNGRVFVHVRDGGWGIPPEMQANIFDAFVRVDQGMIRHVSEGAGLGLTISRQLANAMGGELSVESAPGEGSTFTLTLRRSTPPAAA